MRDPVGNGLSGAPMRLAHVSRTMVVVPAISVSAGSIESKSSAGIAICNVLPVAKSRGLPDDGSVSVAASAQMPTASARLT